MKKITRLVLIVLGTLLLSMLFAGTALAQDENPCEGSFLSCWIAMLQPPSVVGNCYVDGALVEGGKFNICYGVSLFEGSTTIDFREIEEPGNPDFGSLYVYDNVSKTIRISAGQTTYATLTAKKRYIRGIMELTCNIQNYAGENVSCAPTIDGYALASIPAGESVQYIVDPGSHTVVTALTGDPAQMLLWAPGNVQEGRSPDRYP
jgi:hypothetical protein